MTRGYVPDSSEEPSEPISTKLNFGILKQEQMITPPGVEEEKRRLLDEKKRTEDEYETLRARHERGEISDDEFAGRQHELERQFVEIMDRIAQMSYLSGE